MNNFEDALKKLDQIEQNLTNQELAITQKDDRILRLSIVADTVSFLLKKVSKDVAVKEKALVEESKKNQDNQQLQAHFREDVKLLAEQRKELDQQLKELEKTKQESEKLRDEELAQLRGELKGEQDKLVQQQQQVKELTEKLANLTKTTADIQKDDQQIYAVLGEKSTKTGLLLRSQEVIQKLKDWEEGRELADLKTDLGKWTTTFPGQTPKQVKGKLLSTNDILNLDTVFKRVSQDCTKMDEADLKWKITDLNALLNLTFESTDLKTEWVKNSLTALINLLKEFQEEKFWWERWINDFSFDKSEGVGKYFFDRGYVSNISNPAKQKPLFVSSVNLIYNDGIYNKTKPQVLYSCSSLNRHNKSERKEPGKRFIRLLHEYYKNQVRLC